MEQIKENLKAKRIKGYIPRDVFAEDREKREQKRTQAKEKKTKEGQNNPKSKAPERRRKRVESDDEDEYGKFHSLKTWFYV